MYGEVYNYEKIEDSKTISYKIDSKDYNNKNLQTLFRKEKINESDISLKIKASNNSLGYSRYITLMKYEKIKDYDHFKKLTIKKHEEFVEFVDEMYDLEIDAYEIKLLKK